MIEPRPRTLEGSPTSPWIPEKSNHGAKKMTRKLIPWRRRCHRLSDATRRGRTTTRPNLAPPSTDGKQTHLGHKPSLYTAARRFTRLPSPPTPCRRP
ncbi:hypothetical protein BDA96_07G010100 [Sorghum bicolor]|uniref:Uncharacterized protein n=1 Tax=Sorghum bicolor TaxID=4558 RepID=A0A921QKJ0_SORBI|nr:hypothetical protein BDA96_07G010100 [Sorghum bicolor]